MKKLLMLALLLLSANALALPPLDSDGVYVIKNGGIVAYVNTAQCPYYFPDKQSCQSWFGAQGLLGTQIEKLCCDSLQPGLKH